MAGTTPAAQALTVRRRPVHHSVYSTCIFCHAPLGRNEHIEHMLFGQRLAFDSEKGRLWLICLACDGWNLTPLEERWEAVEECERLFRATTLRASTPNIGLARVAGGLDLVRIGQPLRPEFALWRYGDKLRARRRRAYYERLKWHGVRQAGVLALFGAGTGVLLLVKPLLSPAVAVVGLYALRAGMDSLSVALMQAEYKRTVTSIAVNGEVRAISAEHATSGVYFRVRAPAWCLEVSHAGGKSELEPEQTLPFLSQVLPYVNRFQAPKPATLDAAVHLIQDAGDVGRYLDRIPALTAQRGYLYTPVAGYPRELRLGLEMASQERFEHRALYEGELQELERAWREAERIAAIADNLLVPPWVQERIEREHRRRLTRA